MPTLTWSQALAWRMQRHLLQPRGRLGPVEVVERLCGVQAQVPSAAELAVRVRRERSRAGEVQAALEDGSVIRTWAMRGALHVLEARSGAAFLALIADARPWARPSWQRVFGATPERIELLRDAVASVLDGVALTREELIGRLVARPELRDLADGLRSGWGTLLKPLAWQGELCHGPSQGNRVTFMRPKDASPAWTGLPDMATAPGRALTAYLGTHGPATPQRFGQWLAGGYFGTRRLHGWLESLGDAVTQVDVEGEVAWMLTRDVADAEAVQPARHLRLLPGFDQWVLGPGTADAHVVPPYRRSLVSRQAGWISPIVIVGGVVSGTWELDGDTLQMVWFGESGPVPMGELATEVAWLATILGRELRHAVTELPG
jgi:hypothetical protein